jgi:hypothetical protein
VCNKSAPNWQSHGHAAAVRVQNYGQLPEPERQANRAKAAHAEPGAEEAAACTQGPRLAWESVSESQVVAGMIVSIV